jgi:hypothetical protein
MEQKQNGDSDNSFDESGINTSVEQTGNDKPEKQAEQDKTNEINKKPVKVIIEMPSNKTANIIAGVSAGATLVLLFLNYLLYYQISKQTTSIEESASAAKGAVEQYRLANKISDSNYKLSKRAFDSSAKDNHDRFKLDSNNSEKQMAILKNQFAVENEPSLECNSFSVNTLKEDTNLIIIFNISNLGKRAVEIDSTKLFYMILLAPPVNPFNDAAYIKNTFTPFKRYSSRESPAQCVFTSANPISKFLTTGVYATYMKIYFWGEIKYKNNISGQQMVYRFMVQPYKPPSLQYVIIENKNDSIKRIKR